MIFKVKEGENDSLQYSTFTRGSFYLYAVIQGDINSPWLVELQTSEPADVLLIRGNTSLFPCPAPLKQFIALSQQNPSSTTHPINAVVPLTLLTVCKNFNLLQLFFIFMAFTYHCLRYLIGGSLSSFPIILLQFPSQIAGLRISDFHNIPFFAHLCDFSHCISLA